MPPRLIYSLLLFSMLYVLLEARPLFKTRAYKDLAVTSLILILALSYGIDYMMGTQLLPNPNRLIILFKPLSEALNSFFQVNT
ncbi:MAG TPA: hypothetical protein P5549_09445 [Syntrophomonas sp.]|nr:hypothetical protein [Syntrophomonas sp.]